MQAFLLLSHAPHLWSPMLNCIKNQVIQYLILPRRFIGKLLYLTHTRPQISFTISKLSQFMEAPTNLHYQAALRVLEFIKNNPGQVLKFPADSSTTLKGFLDSDWATCPDTRCSITSFCFFLGQSFISWTSKK